MSALRGMRRELFGITAGGEVVDAITLTNANHMEVRFITFGGTIVSVKVPDRHGSLGDVVLGYDTLGEYLDDVYYLGPLIGRYANRIANGQFTLDGTEYTVTRNERTNHLHGGARGLHKVVWSAEQFEGAGRSGAILSYTSPAGEEGYPGTMSVRVTYTLTDDNALILDYHATADQPTPVSLTQHAYFNLAGHGSGNILDHLLTLHSSRFTPVNAELLPTGEIRSVTGTPFDFTTPRAVGLSLDAGDEQLLHGNGYDHNFVLDREAGNALALAARLHEPTSGRTLEIHTTEPGIQFYSGNVLGDGVMGKEGCSYHPYSGLALETQHFPDSPNPPHFPSTILRPGAEYSSRTIYRFSTERTGRRQ
ncbi:MAG TPA: aldose epimerase family protein [Gemmatimonadaceae bacterium]